MNTRIEHSQIIEHMSDGVIVFDAGGMIIDVNPVYERMSRLSRQELIGQYGMDLARKIVDPSDIDDVASAFIAAVDGKPIPALSIHFTFDDGSSLPVIFSTSSVKDETGANSFIITVVKDVSDISRAEEALRISKERFKSIITTSQEWIWAIDATGRHTFSNPAIERILGFTPDEILALDINSLLHEEDIPKVRELLDRCIEQKTGWPSQVLRWKHRNGTYRYLESNAVPILDSEGGLRGFQGSDHDITDQKLAEESLQENLEILAMAERIGKMGSWKQRIPGNDMILSDGVRMILGISEKEEVTFEKILACIHPDDLARLQPKIRDILEKGTPFSEEYRLMLPDGSIKFILGIAEATPGPEGKPVMIHGSLQDITERRQAEEQIRRLLAEKELILREVHHRIKNNMYTIMSLLSVQANMTKDPSVAGALTDAGNRMQSMGLLYDKLYRMEIIQELSIKEYLPALVDEIMQNFPNRNLVRVEKQIEDFTLDVKALSPVGIIVNELITNAMKHAFAGRYDGTITVTAASRNNRVTISVKDNGIGMPESLDTVMTSGLGLQIAGLLADQLQGTLRIEREGGTRFVLEFNI